MTFFKSLVAASALTLAVGCITQDPPSALSTAIPTSDDVAIKLPSTQSNHVSDAVGQLADYYVTTRGVTETLNGGTAWTLVLLHAITDTPPTSVSGNVYTWGPGSQALDPATYRLDVTANTDGTFDYTLSGEPKTNPAIGFLTLISGHAMPGAGPGLGNGNFDISFDNIHTADPIDNPSAAGTVTVDYDLAARHIGLSLTGVMINNQPETASYTYDASADGAGDMTFQVHESLDGQPALEELTLRSRWLATGAGRGDARIDGGDLGTTEVIASECWSTSFVETFYTDSQNWQPTAGDPSTCAFATQDLPPN